MIKIAIHSVPRSGSSWLGEIINSSENVNYSYQPLFSYEFKSALSDISTSEDINNFFTNISTSDSHFIKQKKERAEGKKPKETKTELKAIAYKEVRYHYILRNMAVQCPDIKIIALIRDPIEVINSWYGAKKEFRRDLNWSLDEELNMAEKKNQNRKEEYFGLMKWVEVAKEFEYLKENHKNVYVCNYKNLKENTESEVKKIYSFIGLELGDRTKEFIRNKKDVGGDYSVYKSSKTNISLTEKQIENIKSIVKKSELNFDFK
ncbi:MAG: sulfotransferase domain-containing protein [Psychromonas sp.]